MIFQYSNNFITAVLAENKTASLLGVQYRMCWVHKGPFREFRHSIAESPVFIFEPCQSAFDPIGSTHHENITLEGVSFSAQ